MGCVATSKFYYKIARFTAATAAMNGLDTRTAMQGLVYAPHAPYNSDRGGMPEGGIVQLDNHLKQLLRELGHAINDTVSESSRITDAISEVRAAGFDIVLKLDATIGLARRDADGAKITSTDQHFLESLHIQVDQEILQEDRQAPKFDMTPQDLRFLKSLKISHENFSQ